MITISRRLQILPGNIIKVPGCEPASSATSQSLAEKLLACGQGVVDVATVLEAIPGSRVERWENTGPSAVKWLVLPPVTPECPCPANIDYYGIIKGLSRVIDQEEANIICGAIAQGFCSPNADESYEAPPPSPYVPEGFGLGFQF